MILNPIICEECKRELQPSKIGIKLSKGDSGDLIKVCMFCGHEVNIDANKEKSD